jgi:predicted glycosyltransferase
MRDILDDGAKIRSVWNHHRMFTMLNEYFDAILVFGLEEIYDVVREYRIPAEIASRFRYCGYINRSETFRDPAEVRSDLQLNGDPLILVTAGGGGDGSRIVHTSLEALGKGQHGSIKTLVVLGPDFPCEMGERLRSDYSGSGNIKIFQHVDHLPDIMCAADMVVSMGGYNTICEILSLHKKAIIIPRTEPRKEQLIRAHRLSEIGLLDYIHPDVLSPTLLKRKIMSRIFQAPNQEPDIDMNGLSRSSEVFKELLFR